MGEKKELTVLIYKKLKGIKMPPKELVEKVRRDIIIQNKIKSAISKVPKTVPEIANETGLDTYTVLWYVSTLLRYGLVERVEKTDMGYWKYIWKKR